jgi:DNA-binding transcriptional LysR family regulator
MHVEYYIHSCLMGMDQLSLAELRVFAAVADQLNLSHAAVRLGIGQPSVSRSLSRLERRLGVQLAVRTTRAVTLTTAGHVLHRQARVVLDAVNAAQQLTRRAVDDPNALLVGCKPDGDAGLLPDVLELFAADTRAVPVALTLAAPGELVARLRRGELDVGLIQGPFDHAGLDHELLLDEPRLLAVPPGDRLAEIPSLRISDIPRHRMSCWPGVPLELDLYYRGLDLNSALPMPFPGSSGMLSAPGPQARDLAEALRLVELGRAVTLVPSSVAERYRDRQVHYVAVYGASAAPLTAAWAAGSRSPQIAAFIRAATTAAAAAAQRT